jgi:hypothetical protein
MRCLEKTTGNANMIEHKSLNMVLRFFLSIGLVCLWMGSTPALYGQGTIVETVGTMEIGDQVDNGVNQNTPKGKVDTKTPAKDTNNVTAPPNRAPGGIQQGRPNPEDKPNAQEPNKTATGVAAPTTVPAMSAETNVPDVNDFNSFKREINRIDIEARGEDTQWVDKQEKKADLARAMNDVVLSELRFLRKVAAAANDSNTVEAIDLVLKMRMDRLNKLITKIENETKDERRTQTPDRPRRAPRPTGVQQQNQTERPARSTNPVQRTKETVNQEP